MNPVISIALLDDHQIVIDGLKLLLNDQTDIQVVQQSTTPLELLKWLKVNTVDVVLSDILMPGQLNGIDFMRLVKQQNAQQKILVLSMSEAGKDINELIATIKVEGYIAKSAGRDELLLAIKTICNGEKYFSKHIQALHHNYLELFAETQKLQLSARELEIIQLMVKHYSNKQIAAELFISERTVETHRKNIYRKTDTKGEASLIQMVMDKKIL